MMKKLVLILSFLISYGLTAQENPRRSKPLGINLNIGGPSILLSVSGDYFITPSLNIEAGAGIFGLFGGPKYHFGGNKDNKNWTPYVGFQFMHIPEIHSWFGGTTPTRNGLYIPLGFQYIHDKGFTFAVEIAGITVKDIAGGTKIYGALKWGYHF